MKKISGLLLICFAVSTLQSQEVFNILSGTNVFFGTNTIISSDNLTLVPTSGLTLNGTALSKNTVLLHSSGNLSIARAYSFSNAVTNFSGSIQIKYLDPELNGIMESSLRLNIHNGTSWQNFANNTNDGTGNTVNTTLLNNLTLKELSLADVALALPLQWNVLSAYRVSQTVKIAWNTEHENNISHFTVQRSDNARDWTNVSGDIAATNKETQKYELIDHNYQKQRLYYRVRQSDNNGKIAYSRVIPVAGENSRNITTLFPNPVSNKFYLTGDVNRITKIELYNSAGSLVRSWKEMQGSYDIHDLPAGTYSIRLSKKEDKPQTIQINKQ